MSPAIRYNIFAKVEIYDTFKKNGLKTKWLLYVLWDSTFLKKSAFCPTETVYLFRMTLEKNSDYIPTQNGIKRLRFHNQTWRFGVCEVATNFTYYLNSFKSLCGKVNRSNREKS
jgi:hypothetical protein